MAVIFNSDVFSCYANARSLNEMNLDRFEYVGVYNPRTGKWKKYAECPDLTNYGRGFIGPVFGQKQRKLRYHLYRYKNIYIALKTWGFIFRRQSLGIILTSYYGYYRVDRCYEIGYLTKDNVIKINEGICETYHPL